MQRSRYSTGRVLSDEARYVMDRKGAKDTRGNTLPRPSLLMQPWTVGVAKTNIQRGQGGRPGTASSAQRRSHNAYDLA